MYRWFSNGYNGHSLSHTLFISMQISLTHINSYSKHSALNFSTYRTNFVHLNFTYVRKRAIRYSPKLVSQSSLTLPCALYVSLKMQTYINKANWMEPRSPLFLQKKTI